MKQRELSNEKDALLTKRIHQFLEEKMSQFPDVSR